MSCCQTIMRCYAAFCSWQYSWSILCVAHWPNYCGGPGSSSCMAGAALGQLRALELPGARAMPRHDPGVNFGQPAMFCWLRALGLPCARQPKMAVGAHRCAPVCTEPPPGVHQFDVKAPHACLNCQISAHDAKQLC